MMKLLLERGAELFGNQTPVLNAAAMYGQENIVRFLVEKKHANLDNTSWHGLNAFGCAVIGYKVELMELFLSYGMKVESCLNKTDYCPDHFSNNIYSPTTPLHIAMRNGQQEVVNWLLERGIDINAVDSKNTLLHATLFGRPGLAKYLIQRGANINAKNVMGYSILHYAYNYEVSLLEVTIILCFI